MGYAERRELVPQISDGQVRSMAVQIFEEHLAHDIEDIVAERRFVKPTSTGTLGEVSPQLAAFQRALLDQNLGGDLEQVRTGAIRSYLDYRDKLTRGFLDRYGRPGFIQTVPSETDSAASSVIHDLECPEEDLIMEGPLYRVYDARHRKGRFDLFRVVERYAGESEDEEVVTGKKIVVPLGHYAGHYVSLFVPDDLSPAILWLYDKDGRTYGEDLHSQMKSILSTVVSTDNINNTNAAILYAVQIASRVLPSGEQRVQNLILNTMRQIGVEKPEEELTQILSVVNQYPQVFQPATRNYLDYLRSNKSAITESSPARQAVIILIDPNRHSHDPGLTTLAIKELTAEDIYRQFIIGVYKKVNQVRAELAAISDPTREALLRHLDYHGLCRNFGSIRIPWQAKLLLGEDGLEKLTKGIRGVDPEFEDGDFEFSLLHVPLGMLPEEAASQTQYVRKGEKQQPYLDMGLMLVDYQNEIARLMEQWNSKETSDTPHNR